MKPILPLELKLYHYWRSSCSWRVRWALAHKKIPCEFIPVNLLTDEPESAEHLRRNPLGYVPALGIRTESGWTCLAESIAILEWLEEIHPEAPLISRDPFTRAKTRQLVEIINAGTQPLQNLNVLHFFSSDPKEQKRWAQHWIRNGLQAYEAVAKETAGTYSVGNTVSWADLALIPQCYNAGRQEVSLEGFPVVKRIFENALKTPGCQASHPDRFAPPSA